MNYRITYKYHDGTVLSLLRSKDEMGIYADHEDFKVGSFPVGGPTAGSMINYLESFGLARGSLSTWKIKRVTIRPDYVRSITV